MLCFVIDGVGMIHIHLYVCTTCLSLIDDASSSAVVQNAATESASGHHYGSPFTTNLALHPL